MAGVASACTQVHLFLVLSLDDLEVSKLVTFPFVNVNGKYSYKDRTGRCLPKSNDITIFFDFIIMPFSSFAEIFLHLWKMDNKFWFRISMNTSSNNQLVVTWGGQNLTMFVCYPKDPVLRHCISYEHHKKASDRLAKRNDYTFRTLIDKK